jgi:CDP-diacylglycerol--glycerol-3-phosphate 3-phosphatidyltransferase
MPSIYDLKPRFQGLLRPLAQRLAATGVTANQVTLAAAALSCATGALIALFPRVSALLLILPLVLFARMALNAIDGMLAREHGQKSRLGAILNELGDVVSDAALYLPLALIPALSAAAVVALVVLGIIVEMTGVVAVQIGASRRYDGPLGKSDRAFLFGLVAVLLALNLTPASWINALLWLGVALSALTIVNRARAALREAEEKEKTAS